MLAVSSERNTTLVSNLVGFVVWMSDMTRECYVATRVRTTGWHCWSSQRADQVQQHENESGGIVYIKVSCCSL
jgi:hypothetical protein